jgi:serine phosphatase RsbU (regulator of sigma subunit)
MTERLLLAAATVAVVAAAFIWGRSAQRLRRAAGRIEVGQGRHTEVSRLARISYRKDIHAAALYGLAAIGLGADVVTDAGWADGLRALIIVPVLASIYYARGIWSHARLTESRSQLEQRAQEVLVQEALAPKRWAARLAPEIVPEFPGFEVGTLYEAGTGAMAGDFFDVFRTSPSRIAAVIGDVAGHGIEPSITAFQAKYLLRVFLRQFRDPGQALEELNTQITGMGRGEEFISMCVVVLDTDTSTLRYASAGHPPGFLWHGGEVLPLRTTGPLISLIPDAEYSSREVPLALGDVLLLYTDGLGEARSGESLFGEERIAAHLRRDPNVNPAVLCKSLVEAAEDFASQPITDDIAILALRRA